jgi:hypothetical protein
MRMCRQTFVKCPCCNVRIADWGITDCENGHLIEEPGHLKEAEVDMFTECHPCRHAELAKKEIAAVHIAADKYAIQAQLAKEKGKWLQKWLQCILL